MARLTDLPVEIVLEILGNLTGLDEISCFSRSCRPMHYLAFWKLYDAILPKTWTERMTARPMLCRVFIHAVHCDSSIIIRWLTSHPLASILKGIVDPFARRFEITHLHYSILCDAPKVASELVKYGADIHLEDGAYPDLVPLYLALARPHTCTKEELNNALRIACSYALPRTAKVLLVRGADPNALSCFGLAAIHMAVMKRLPWRRFIQIHRFAFCNGLVNEDQDITWNSQILKTLSILLDFGGDPNLASATSRVHTCDSKCWRSPDCEHRGQRVLHFACSLGDKHTVQTLVKNGANPQLVDEDGYLPSFPALAQGHEDTAEFLLNYFPASINPIASKTLSSTTLHIACRFASSTIVSMLLARDADPNVIDTLGRTPLHEALSQDAKNLESNLVEIIYCLKDHGGSPDIKMAEGESVYDIAASHRSKRVREIFQGLEPNEFHLEYEVTGESEILIDEDYEIILLSSFLTLPLMCRQQIARQPRKMEDINCDESFPQLTLLRSEAKLLRPPPSIWCDEDRRKQLIVKERPALSLHKSFKRHTMGRGTNNGDSRLEPTPGPAPIELGETDSSKSWATFAKLPKAQQVNLVNPNYTGNKVYEKDQNKSNPNTRKG